MSDKIARVLGTWELGWNTPIKEVELWEFVLKEFGVEQLFMSPATGIYNAFVREFPDMSPVIENNRSEGFTVVFADEYAETDLPSFVHPDKALYVFGKASLSPTASYFLEGDLKVKIPTLLNSGGFWPHQAAGVILYDRYLKSL